MRNIVPIVIMYIVHSIYVYIILDVPIKHLNVYRLNIFGNYYSFRYISTVIASFKDKTKSVQIKVHCAPVLYVKLLFNSR